MFDINALLWLTLLCAIAFYWIHAMRSKDIAFNAAQKHCEQMQVQFLDQSVYLKHIRFKRNEQGYLNLWRDFYFEFTVNGDDRYHGHVILSGKKIITVQLAPHRLH